jgi:hypothetical protein
MTLIKVENERNHVGGGLKLKMHFTIAGGSH